MKKTKYTKINVNDGNSNIIPYTLTNGKILEMIADPNNLSLNIIMKTY